MGFVGVRRRDWRHLDGAKRRNRTWKKLSQSMFLCLITNLIVLKVKQGYFDLTYRQCAAWETFRLPGCGGDLRSLGTLPTYLRSKLKGFTEGVIPENSGMCNNHVQELSKNFRTQCANPFGSHPAKAKGRPVKGAKYLEIVSLRDGLIQPLDSLCGYCMKRACDPVGVEGAEIHQGIEVQVAPDVEERVMPVVGGIEAQENAENEDEQIQALNEQGQEEDMQGGNEDREEQDVENNGEEEEEGSREDESDTDDDDYVETEDEDDNADQASELELAGNFSDQNLAKLNKIRRLVGLQGVTFGRRNSRGKIKLVKTSALEVQAAICELFGVSTAYENPASIDTVKVANAMDCLKRKLQNAVRSERIKIAALFAESLSLEQLQESFSISNRGARIAKKLKDEPVLAEPPKKTQPGISKNVEKAVQECYLSEDNSKQSANARDVCKIIDEDGRETFTTKRFLLKSVGEIYADFKNEEKNKDIKVGRTKFFQLRPPQCKLLKETKNQVCLCIYHENVRLLFDAVGLKFSDYVEYLVCNKDSKPCMFRRCDLCNTERKESDFSEKLKADILAKSPRYEHLDVPFNEWSTSGRELMVKCAMELDDFINHLSAKLSTFLRHHFTSLHQGNSWKQMKSQVDHTMAVIQCDFAENYTSTYNMEVSRAFYNQQQTTIHPFVVTLMNKDGNIENVSYVVISDELAHNSSTYYVFQRHVIDEIKKEYPQIQSVNYWSDGAGSQYKNFKNMSNLKHHKLDHGINANHHFFASCHGKGPCDAVGGVVKSCVRRAAQGGKIIQEPREVYDFVKDKLKKYKFLFVSSEIVQDVIRETKLEERYANAIKIPLY